MCKMYTTPSYKSVFAKFWNPMEQSCSTSGQLAECGLKGHFKCTLTTEKVETFGRPIYWSFFGWVGMEETSTYPHPRAQEKTDNLSRHIAVLSTKSKTKEILTG